LALNYTTLKLKKITLNIYFNEQTFVDMCTKIHDDILHFNEDTKQSSAVCQNAQRPQRI